MAIEITRAAATSGEEFHAAPTDPVDEDTIITQYVVVGGGPVIPVDPTAGEGLDSGYASEESHAAPASGEESSVLA